MTDRLNEALYQKAIGAVGKLPFSELEKVCDGKLDIISKQLKAAGLNLNNPFEREILMQQARLRLEGESKLDTVEFNGIYFERESPRRSIGVKRLYKYEESIKKVNFYRARHAYPSEIFSLLIARLEGKLTQEQKAIYDDMLSSYGEWLSMAWQRKKDKIILYSDPENLEWNGSKYAANGKLICSNEIEFPLAKNIPHSEWIDLNKFDDGLVKFLYSRQFAQLPKEMREGDRRAQLYLPPENTLWPLGRGDYDLNYFIVGYDYYYRASRWVAVTHENFHGK